MNITKHSVTGDLERMREGDRVEITHDDVTASVTMDTDGFAVAIDDQVEAEGCDVSVAAEIVVDLLGQGDRVRHAWAALVNEWRAIITATDTGDRSRDRQVVRLTERWDGTWDDETGTGQMAGTISLADGLALAIVTDESLALYGADDGPMDPPVEELLAGEVAS